MTGIILDFLVLSGYGIGPQFGAKFWFSRLALIEWRFLTAHQNYHPRYENDSQMSASCRIHTTSAIYKKSAGTWRVSYYKLEPPNFWLTNFRRSSRRGSKTDRDVLKLLRLSPKFCRSSYNDTSPNESTTSNLIYASASRYQSKLVIKY